MKNKKDYYEILEISPTASDEVIKMAYKALVKKYHPDVYENKTQEFEKKMKDINEAYEILSNPQKRTQYDYFRKYTLVSTHNTNNVQEEKQENYTKFVLIALIVIIFSITYIAYVANSATMIGSP